MKPALVVSGHTMGLGVTRALGEAGIPIMLLHYDRRDIAHHSRYVIEAVPAPHPEKGEEEFLSLLHRLAERYPGSPLIPTSDEALHVLARHKTDLSREFIPCCPDWQVARDCLDKKRTYALAEEHGIPAPITRLPSSAAQARRQAAEIGYPLLVKPCESHSFFARFGRKMYCVGNEGEMLAIVDRAEEAGLQVMLQEIIPGDDGQVVNYNAYAWEGGILVEFTAEHVRSAPPWFGSPRVALSREIPEVLPAGRRMLQALVFSGYACSEFKRDPRDGVFKLMEVNARHNLSTLLAVRCGINFPLLEYRHRVCGEGPVSQTFRSGIYWIDLTRDVAYGLKYLRQERLSLRRQLRPYLQPHVFAIINRDDPQPFRQRCRFLAGEAIGGLLSPLRGRRRVRRETAFPAASHPHSGD